MEPEQTPVAPHECEAVAALARRLAGNIGGAVQVRTDTLTHLMVALFAGGVDGLATDLPTQATRSRNEAISLLNRGKPQPRSYDDQ